MVQCVTKTCSVPFRPCSPSSHTPLPVLQSFQGQHHQGPLPPPVRGVRRYGHIPLQQPSFRSMAGRMCLVWGRLLLPLLVCLTRGPHPVRPQWLGQEARCIHRLSTNISRSVLELYDCVQGVHMYVYKVYMCMCTRCTHICVHGVHVCVYMVYTCMCTFFKF